MEQKQDIVKINPIGVNFIKFEWFTDWFRYVGFDNCGNVIGREKKGKTYEIGQLYLFVHLLFLQQNYGKQSFSKTLDYFVEKSGLDKRRISSYFNFLEKQNIILRERKNCQYGAYTFYRINYAELARQNVLSKIYRTDYGTCKDDYTDDKIVGIELFEGIRQYFVDLAEGYSIKEPTKLQTRALDRRINVIYDNLCRYMDQIKSRFNDGKIVANSGSYFHDYESLAVDTHPNLSKTLRERINLAIQQKYSDDDIEKGFYSYYRSLLQGIEPYPANNAVNIFVHFLQYDKTSQEFPLLDKHVNIYSTSYGYIKSDDIVYDNDLSFVDSLDFVDSDYLHPYKELLMYLWKVKGFKVKYTGKLRELYEDLLSKADTPEGAHACVYDMYCLNRFEIEEPLDVEDCENPDTFLDKLKNYKN